jgi:hypothetical protein
MDMLRPDDVVGYDEVIAKTHGFERLFEEVAGAWGGEVGEPVISDEGDEVEVSCVLVSYEVVGHGWMVDEGLVGWKPRIGNRSGKRVWVS